MLSGLETTGAHRESFPDRFGPAHEVCGKRCPSDNQGCFDSVFAGQPVTCMINPRAGREAERVIELAPQQRAVLVVGGGPAGMTAALTAARRGHRVTLIDRAGRLGGQLRLAAAVPGREEMATLVRDLARQLDEAGVEIRLGVAATVAAVARADADAVVIATGARPLRPQMEGADLPCVVPRQQDGGPAQARNQPVCGPCLVPPFP